MSKDWDKKQKERLEKFLMSDYFNISDRDDPKIVNNCAERAYFDMCRTLRFNKRCNDLGNKKKNFREDVDAIIVDGIEKLKGYSSQRGYDGKYAKICEAIKVKSNAPEYSDMLQEAFNFGQAQKWLNMTIKYLWLLGQWNPENQELIHAPIDNYIIQSAVNGIGGIKELLPKVEETQAVKAWSKWDGDEDYESYKKIQEKIRKHANEKGITPIEWEYEEWPKSKSNTGGRKE